MYLHQPQEMLSRCISTDSTCGALARNYHGHPSGETVTGLAYLKDQNNALYYTSASNEGYTYRDSGFNAQLATSSIYVSDTYTVKSHQATSKDDYPLRYQEKNNGGFEDCLSSTLSWPVTYFDPPDQGLPIPPTWRSQPPQLTNDPAASQLVRSSLYRLAPEDHAAALVEQPIPRFTALPRCLSNFPDPQPQSQLGHDGKSYQHITHPAYSPPNVVYAEHEAPVSQNASPSVTLALPRHGSISPKQHSSYSELSANVEYFSNVDCSSHKSPAPAQVQALSTGSQVSMKKSKESLIGPIRAPNKQVPVSSLLRKSPPVIDNSSDPASTSDTRQPACIPPSKRQEKGKPRTSPSTTPYPKTAKSASKKSSSEPKRLSLACLFCRERKIACGRPAAGSVDQRCNQCVRRSFDCTYPTESRRGQHKRIHKKSALHEAHTHAAH